MQQRHELAWLTTEGWRIALAAALPQHRSSLEQWQRNDWPAVVRRDEPGADPARELCLGIALPPDANSVKLRIPLRVDLAHIARHAAALPLDAAGEALPSAWRSPYTTLQRQAEGLDLRVYGSLSWQALTGLPCLTPASDIDLLFRPTSEAQLRAGLAMLAMAARALPLDGEIMFPDGRAVSWKEWLAAEAAQARVLVKDRQVVSLMRRETLLESLEPA